MFQRKKKDRKRNLTWMEVRKIDFGEDLSSEQEKNIVWVLVMGPTVRGITAAVTRPCVLPPRSPERDWRRRRAPRRSGAGGNVGVLVAGRRLGSGSQAGRQRQAYACARQQQQPTAGARARTCGCTAREPGGAAAVAPRVRPTGTYPLLLPAPVGRPAGLPREASR